MTSSVSKFRQAEAHKNWQQARSAALWAKLKGPLDEERHLLLDFNEVSRRLHLRNTRYRGVQSIPLDQIVGSMGRYRDFTRTFLPLHKSLRPRWESVAASTLPPAARAYRPSRCSKPAPGISSKTAITGAQSRASLA